MYVSLIPGPKITRLDEVRQFSVQPSSPSVGRACQILGVARWLPDRTLGSSQASADERTLAAAFDFTHQFSRGPARDSVVAVHSLLVLEHPCERPGAEAFTLESKPTEPTRGGEIGQP